MYMWSPSWTPSHLPIPSHPSGSSQCTSPERSVWQRYLRNWSNGVQSNHSFIDIIFIYFLFSFSFIFISWRLITLQYCSGFCHTLTWISHGFTCVPHPDPPSHLPLHPLPLVSFCYRGLIISGARMQSWPQIYTGYEAILGEIRRLPPSPRKLHSQTNHRRTLAYRWAKPKPYFQSYLEGERIL